MRWTAPFLLAFSLLSLNAAAAVLETRIVDVEVEAGDSKVMILAETEGRVLWAEASDKSLVKAFQEASTSGRHLRVNYDAEKGTVFGVVLLAKRAEAPVVTSAQKDDDTYIPTVFPSVSNAQSYFNTMDGQTKDDSQCYNRAHGWAYDLFTQYRVNSLKVFIFFTKRYIREFSYKWWFHVSPMVLVAGNRGGNTEMVMDRSFTQGPVDVGTWTNIFMKNQAWCPTVRYYSEYSRNQEAQYCYLMKAIMYYSTPRDMEYLESRGRYENDWVYSELKAGREQAFINWQRYDP